MNTPKRDIPAIAFGLFVLALMFAPFLFKGRALAPLDLVDSLYPPWSKMTDDRDISVRNPFVSDAIEQYLPYRYLAHRAFRSGDSLRWNDLNYGGQAQYANTMALYYDWSMQLHRGLDFWTAWTLGLLLQFGIAVFAMYGMLRVYRLPPMAAILGGVAYGFNGLFLGWVYHRWMLGAFCGLPLWIAWVELGSQGRRWAWPLAALTLTLGLLGGHLQFAVFYGIVLLVLLWKRPAVRKPLLSVAVLGFGMAACMLLPCVLKYWEGLPARPSKQALGFLVGGWQAPFRNLLAYVTFPFPSLFSSPGTFDPYARIFLFSPFDIPYVGSVLTLLALCIPFAKRLRKHVPPEALWLMTAGLVLPLTPLNGFLYHRILILFCLGSVWCGLILLRSTAPEDWITPVQWTARIFILLLAGWILAGGLLAIFHDRILEQGYPVFAAFARRGEYRHAHLEPWMFQRFEQMLLEKRPWHVRQIGPILALAGSIGALRAYARRRIAFHHLMALLCVCTTMELAANAAQWLVFVPPPPATETLYADNRHTRMIRRHIPRTGRVTIVPSGSPHPLFQPNTLSTLGIPQDRGYETIPPLRAYQRALRSTDARDAARMGITHAIAGPGASALPWPWQVVSASDPLTVYTNTLSLGRYAVRVADSIRPPVIRHHASAARKLLLPEGAHTLEVRENWDEGWAFRLHGQAWRALQMDPETFMMYASFEPLTEPSAVELRYRPAIFRQGWWWSAGFAAVWMGWLAASLRNRTHRQTGKMVSHLPSPGSPRIMENGTHNPPTAARGGPAGRARIR